MDSDRRQRLKLLVKKHNRARRRQAQKIDILCNDFVAAHRDFIRKLDIISFTAGFYESIIGIMDLNALFYAAGRLIKDKTCDANIAFFLRQQKDFELHLLERDEPIGLEKQRLENFFTPQLVDNICKSNKPCNLESLLVMGLQCSPAILNKISVATIPLSQAGISVGFILIYRTSENRLAQTELDHILAVSAGLAKAINCYRTHSPLAADGLDQ